MTKTLDRPKLGEGAYTFPEAARILRGVTRDLSVSTLRYWMDTGLTPASRSFQGEPVLTFEDLVSLEIVHRLRDEGASLQGIRLVEHALREQTAFERPFAYEIFFTDGASVWAQIAGEEGPLLLEILGKRRQHYVWREAIQTFARDIQFDGPDKRATRWRVSPWVEINPSLQFGAPVVAGSRVTVNTIAANLEAGTPEQVADWYGLRVEQVVGVRDYLAAR